MEKIKIESMDELYDGMEVRGSIKDCEERINVEFYFGIIVKYKDNFYLCTDNPNLNGRGCADKRGLKYSWIISNLDNKNIYQIIRTINDLRGGDIIIDSDGDKRKILGVHKNTGD